MHGTNRPVEHHIGCAGKTHRHASACRPASGRFEPVSACEYFPNISVNVNRDPILPGVTGTVAENKTNTQPEEK
jgi:hypothetical protein